MKMIKNAEHAITLLGGSGLAGQLFAPRVEQRVVANWRKRGLPADTMLVLGPALTALGYRYSPYRLFNMRQPRHGGQDDHAG